MDQTPALGATALQLLVTAERLFARHGIDGVSLRQIAAAAGSANNSAVTYHFGSKDDLLAAIFSYRVSDLTRSRDLLRARLDPDDVHDTVEAHIVPLLELAESPDSSYVAFVEQLQRAGHLVIVDHPDVLRSRQQFVNDMGRLLSHIDEPTRSLRIEQVQDVGLHLAAERERSVQRGDARPDFGLFVNTTVDSLAGMLVAPIAKAIKSSTNRSGARGRG
jgi:AcrR family transcriptional regulator